MISAALLPFTEAALPIVRHFDEQQNTYKFKRLFAWEGLGVVGKDAAYICNQTPIGINISRTGDCFFRGWDTLIVDYDQMNDSTSTMMNASFFQECISNKKDILFVGNITDGLLCSCMERDPETISMLNTETSINLGMWADEKSDSIPVPVIGVGGLISSSDTLEAVLSLRNYFLKEGHTVSCITKSSLGLLFGMHSHGPIFDNMSLSEEKKILLLNQITRAVVGRERPELVIVELPDAVMKYSDDAPNGFGIRTYMLSQAVDLDCFICCMPCELVSKDFIEHINQSFWEKLQISLSGVYATNMLIDSVSLVQNGKPSHVRIDVELASKIVQKNSEGCLVPVFYMSPSGDNSENFRHYARSLFR